jgi:hypothetical protein
MSRRVTLSVKTPAPARNNAARASRKFVTLGKRERISSAALRGPYLPPEQWYEPAEQTTGRFSVVVQRAGNGYRHVIGEEEIRARLAQLPDWMTKPLEVVQLSRMTRKKRRSPCYGMQWGNAIYLYPMEESLVEAFPNPPTPAQRIESSMYGARWSHDDGQWRLTWTEEAICDFYLNNVLIHELGHVLDNRNNSSRDRERFAEWFAVEVGYKASRPQQLAERAVNKYVVRRHG